jgi:hypothetical protein
MSESRLTRLESLRPRNPQAAKQNYSKASWNESSGDSETSAQYLQTSPSTTPTTSYSPSLPSSDSEYKPPQKRTKKVRHKDFRDKRARRTANKRKQTADLREREPIEHWDSTWDAQWYKPTDTAWSGHSQSPGDIVYPRRFEDPDWNVLNEWWWVNKKGPLSALGMGEWRELIRDEASSKSVLEFKGLSRDEAQSTVATPAADCRQPICPLCGNAHTAEECPICDFCLACGRIRETCGGFNPAQSIE